MTFTVGRTFLFEANMTSIILLSVFGILNLFLGFLRSNKVLLPGAMLLLLAVFGANYADWNVVHAPYFNNMLVVDNYTVAFTGIVLLTTILLLPFSRSYVTDGEPNLAEYYALLLFSLVGAIMMVGYDHLLMLFVGIEILSISMYVLAGSSKRDSRSNEAALKYFLIPASCFSASRCSTAPRAHSRSRSWPRP
jgi:NADH-quinone oxidoreductase subunit N